MPLPAARVAKQVRRGGAETLPGARWRTDERCWSSPSLLLRMILHRTRAAEALGAYLPRRASSASSASSRRTAKNSFDWPMNSPTYHISPDEETYEQRCIHVGLIRPPRRSSARAGAAEIPERRFPARYAPYSARAGGMMRRGLSAVEQRSASRFGTICVQGSRKSYKSTSKRYELLLSA